MFKAGDLIDGRYLLTSICSDSGGMGEIYFADDQHQEGQVRLILKYCKYTDDEVRLRFDREVRVMASLLTNSKVADIISFNTMYNPSYFVMKFYPDGDLTNKVVDCVSSSAILEDVLGGMIDCVSELHQRGIVHRDIKPQNFLQDGNSIVISDFGLSSEFESSTKFTHSSHSWGTEGFIPPEFNERGGFKNATNLSDIFMLGKTIYVMASGRSPQYLSASNIEPPVYHVIRKACEEKPENRYQSIYELKQSLLLAFDVVNGRGGHFNNACQLLESISDDLESSNSYNEKNVADFITAFVALNEGDKNNLSERLPRKFFNIACQIQPPNNIERLLEAYQEHVEGKNYSWFHAETIANHMVDAFRGENISDEYKGLALKIAINASIYMNRFAAMDTCASMIKNVPDSNLASEVAAVISNYQDTSFIVNIERSDVKSRAISTVLDRFQSF